MQLPHGTSKQECDAAIRAAQEVYGQNWRAQLLNAWHSGNYGALRGTEHTCILQRMRNTPDAELHAHYGTPFRREVRK